jgi:hypothetical protein
MTYAPAGKQYGVAPFVFPNSIHSWGPGIVQHVGTTPTSAAWPATNRAYYFPVIIPQPCTMYRFFWLNGATASTNNLQVGIYNDNDAGTDGPGTAILRGTSTLASGANVCQFDNITDTPLDKGRYWLALWGSGTTTTVFRNAPSATFVRYIGGYLESSLASGLPATATPAQVATPFVPIFGFTTIATP